MDESMSELQCKSESYDQSDFYNCTEWVFSDADNMDGTKAFSFEFRGLLYKMLRIDL